MPAPPKSPTARYVERRDLILDAAARLFNEKGLRGATLADVAEAVGLVTHSVTYYYPRKDELAAACFLRSIEVIDRLVGEAQAQPDPSSRIRHLLNSYLQLLAEMVRQQRPELIMFRDLRALADSHADAVFNAYTNLYRSVRQLLTPNQSTGRASAAQNAKAHILLSSINGVRLWIDSIDPDDFPRVATHVFDLLMNGFAAANSEWAPLVRGPAPLSAATSDAVTPQSFLQAATVLINDQGYKGASVDKISAYLHVTKGSFYHHNDDKDDLVARCFDRSFAIIRQAQERAQRIDADNWTRLVAVASDLVAFQLGPDGPLLRNTALSALPAALRADVLGCIRKLSERFANFFVDGVIDGSVRPVDPRIAAHLINSAINASAELPRWVPAVAPAEAVELFVRPLMLGILRD